jgi:hypothetical protein
MKMANKEDLSLLVQDHSKVELILKPKILSDGILAQKYFQKQKKNQE